MEVLKHLNISSFNFISFKRAVSVTCYSYEKRAFGNGTIKFFVSYFLSAEVLLLLILLLSNSRSVEKSNTAMEVMTQAIKSKAYFPR